MLEEALGTFAGSAGFWLEGASALGFRHSLLIPCHSRSCGNDRRMNRVIRLFVRRPERIVGHVRQGVIGALRDLRNAVDRLRSEVVAEDVFTGQVKVRVLLEVVGPINRSDGSAARFVGFDRVLIDRGVDQTEIVDNAAGLRTLTSAEESGHCNRRQQRNDRHYDHDFHEGEAPAAFVESV